MKPPDEKQPLALDYESPQPAQSAEELIYDLIQQGLVKPRELGVYSPTIRLLIWSVFAATVIGGIILVFSISFG